MRVLVLCSFALLDLLFHANALTCRSDGGPKEEELKMIYMNCLKSQDGKNSSNSRDYSDDYSSREKRKHSKGSNFGRRENAFGGREESYGSRDEWTDRDWTRSRDQTQSRGDWSSRDDKVSSGTTQYGRSESGSSRDSMNNMRTSTNNMRNNMNSRDSRMGGGREDYGDNDYESDTHGYNNRQQQSRRMKRERSSGHRSQYNPNTSRSGSGSGSGSGHDDSYRNNDKNSSENNSSRDSDHKACALHCFLEELEMTGDNGMPDRYLVTQVITKDVKNEDLRDFLQESIEECFQILYNENMQDKCDFSKNLMLCLSEKGRANCDDWKDDIKI
ncbi:general odorant-binding protein 71 [Plutella xylostella]|uniref:general odorant-binding protein 71 n=1 Tax=Plutella xylostella TaxID=51655 RepID=UPI002032DF04|nr:general odorant-binding protein 71 [Plutella xylostella]